MIKVNKATSVFIFINHIQCGIINLKTDGVGIRKENSRLVRIIS